MRSRTLAEFAHLPPLVSIEEARDDLPMPPARPSPAPLASPPHPPSGSSAVGTRDDIVPERAVARQLGAAPGVTHGLLRGVVVAFLGVTVSSLASCTPTPTEPCGGPCPAGQECREDRCAAIELAAAETGDEAKKPRSRARKRARAANEVNEASSGKEVTSGEVPAMPDDRKVPRFDPDADQTVEMDVGGERLGDATFRAEMKELRATFDRCIADAFARDPSLPGGSVKFEIGIAANGRVQGVNASGPAKLADAGGIACLRLAIHKHRFPSWDGPPASTRYELTYD